MGTAAIKELRGQGELRLFGTSGNKHVAHRAAATVTGTYPITWPAAAAAGARNMRIDAAGVVSFSVGGGDSLDTAYDFGGAGGGRIMTSDGGPVESAGAGGFLASHTAPVYGLETTGEEYNFRLTAGQTAGIMEIQRGDADGDISDDTFDALFALDGPNRRLGVNTVAPATDVHILGLAAANAKLTIQAVVAQDASVIFNENATDRFEMGYDDSAGGFVLGLTNFANPVVFVEDTTGAVGIGTVAPASNLHVKAPAAATGKFTLEADASESALLAFSQAATELWLAGYGDSTGGLIFSFTPFSTVAMFIEDSTDRVGIGTVSPGAQLEVQNDSVGGVALLIDQNSTTAVAQRIDSLSVSSPLLHLNGAAGNVEGQLRFTAQTAEPSAPVKGDIYYTASTDFDRFGVSILATPVNVDFASRFGSVMFSQHVTTVTLATGAVVPLSGIVTLAAEPAGTTDDLDTITATEHKVGDCLMLQADAGDTITVKHATGNILLDGSADKALVNSNWFEVCWDGTNWRQVTAMMVLP